MSDDATPPAEQFMLGDPATSVTIYIAAELGGEVKGIWGLVPHTHWMWEAHIALLPELWGPNAVVASSEFLRWTWANTPCERLIANLPVFRCEVIKFAKRMGMEQCGLHPKAYLRDGVMHDVAVFGMNRPTE